MVVMVDFVHLRCHTEFSLSDGILRMASWLPQVQQSMPAVAMTDVCNLFGLVTIKRSLTLSKRLLLKSKSAMVLK